jgi:hypothetical protein
MSDVRAWLHRRGIRMKHVSRKLGSLDELWAPHTGGPTSRQAADEILDSVSRIRRMVLEVIRKQGKHGATRDEILQVLERYGIKHQTVTARASELKDGGWIWELEEKRLTRSGRPAYVLVLTDRCRELYENCGDPTTLSDLAKSDD